MWFSRPSGPPPDEALDADEREEVRSQAEEMGELRPSGDEHHPELQP